MTGPEHYRKAEDLLSEGTGDPTERGTNRLAAAAVHAVLALAAATALGADLEMPEWGAWRRVAARGRRGGL